MFLCFLRFLHRDRPGGRFLYTGCMVRHFPRFLPASLAGLPCALHQRLCLDFSRVFHQRLWFGFFRALHQRLMLGFSRAFCQRLSRCGLSFYRALYQRLLLGFSSVFFNSTYGCPSPAPYTSVCCCSCSWT